MKLLNVIKKSPAGKLLIAVPVIILVVVLFLALRKDKVDNSVKLQQGIAYLEALEAKNPQDMMEELRAKQREEESAKVDEILARIDSGEISIWSQFNGAAILGDWKKARCARMPWITLTLSPPPIRHVYSLPME